MVSAVRSASEPPSDVVRQLRSAGAVDAHGWARLGDGYEADIYTTSAVFGDGRHQLAVRLRRDASTDRIRREAEAMRSLHRHGFPVPRVVCVSTPDISTGRPFLVMERVRGRSLGEDYWSGDRTRRARARCLLLDLHRRLHCIEPDGVLAHPVRTRTLAGDHALLETELARQDDRTREAFASVLDRLRFPATHIPERAVVVHGDFHYNNVLVDDEGGATVIDWSNVCAADPRTDLGWLRMVTGDPDISAYASDLGPAEDVDVFEAVATARVLFEVVTTMFNPNTAADAINRERAGAHHTIAAVGRLQDLIRAPLANLTSLVDAALAPKS